MLQNASLLEDELTAKETSTTGDRGQGVGGGWVNTTQGNGLSF